MNEDGHYQLAGTRHAASDPAFHQALRLAHAERRRPRCLCAPAAPEMVVAQVGGQFILKRMPGTGHRHAPACASFEPPPELSGLGQVAGKAIVTGDDGGTTLKLDFPLSVRGARSIPDAAEAGEATSALAPPTRLSLLATLHYLWDTAELTRWRPAFAGKRSWSVIHREILKVAAHTTVTSASLASRLLIPPPFRPEQRDQLAAARRAFLQQLAPATGQALPLGIVVGELKVLEPSQYGRRVVFKHMPGFSFFMDEALCKRFDKVLGGKVMTVEAIPGAHLVLIATFNVRGGHAEIREIAGMTVTEQWLPFTDERELQLIGALRERQFVKCLTFNLRPEAPVATALLLDTAEPVALFCPSDSLTPDQAAELETIAREGVYTPWIWPAGQIEMPELPQTRGKRSA